MTAATATEPSTRRHGELLQLVTMGIVVAVVAGVVLYPIFYLIQASLDVGIADVRPPTAYGFDNFAKLLDYQAII